MHFKRLELVGFKSFAEKTTIHFEPGVTAIVGPNGCGKSNIADAIKWVLGEQSAKSLRGSSMEDVIFNGSAGKEPLNLAEVSLTFSNEAKILNIDYDEVTISRRLYRSGESEYLLNKNTVRLRDIQEILMGTGIGTGNYSAIEQGKMDVILSSKPEDRRVIFEEAAGITKFKAKKKEALRKLEQTESNLLRVNDIIAEVRRQIASIERQAKKAEKYKTEFEKLKNLEIDMASRQFLIFQTRRDEKIKALETLRSEEQGHSGELGRLEQEYKERKNVFDALAERLAEGQAKELSASGDIRRSQDRVLLNRERLGELQEKNENLAEQLGFAKKRIQELDEEFQNLETQYQAAQKEEEESRAFLEKAEAASRDFQSTLEALQKKEDSLKADLVEILSEKANLHTESARIHARVNELQARLERLDESQSKANREHYEISNRLKASIHRVESLEKNLVERIDEKARAEARFRGLSKDAEARKTRCDELTLEESTLQSKLAFLQDSAHKQEGFLGGVKALLAANKEPENALTGMRGLLANYVEVAPGYELAAEAAFEAYLQAVLFQTREDVLRAIGFLRRAKRGRAILLSLDRESPFSEEAEERSVLKFLKVRDPAGPLVRQLVGSVILCADPSEAQRLTRENPGTVCVTREGERFEGQVVMGGSVSQEADMSVVGRDGRVKTFEETLRKTQGDLAETTRRLAEDRTAIAGLEAEIEEAAKEVMQAQMALTEEKGKLRHTEEAKERHEEELQLLGKETRDVLQEIEQLREEERTQTTRREAAVSREETLTKELRETQDGIDEKNKGREAHLVRLTECRSRQEHHAAKLDKIVKDKGWIEESRRNEQQRIAAMEEERREAADKKTVFEKETVELQAKIEQQTAARDHVLVEIESSKREKEACEKLMEGVLSKKNEKEQWLKELGGKTHQFEMESSQIGFEIDKIRDRLFNVYQTDLSAEPKRPDAPDPEPAFDLEAGQEAIRLQKERVDKLGSVNLVAIQEHDEMKERFEFLTKQEEDLKKAKEDLHKAIQKINRTTKEMFQDTFEKVQKHFTEYYRLLFGGGTAELILLDEKDVLESGVEIVAKPPGKKLQSITLLSGGEKALTAVALLFALFKVKPSPFCILDEIDAPLDDTNVDRFCTVLQDFISHSQFILVTHNKRTMSLADALYGITMAENGLSKIVSVKFSDKKKKGRKKEVLV